MTCPFKRSLTAPKEFHRGPAPHYALIAIRILALALSLFAGLLVAPDDARLVYFVIPVLLISFFSGRAYGITAAVLAALVFFTLAEPSEALIAELSIFTGAGFAASYVASGLLKEHREWRRTLDALHESEARLSGLVESAVDGIITINEHGIILSANKASEELFQYEKRELEGNNINILMPDPDRSNHDRYIANYIKTGERKIIGIGREVVGRRKDGTLFPMDLSVSEVNVNGRRTFTGLVHDVSDRKAAEEERKVMLAKEREARSEAERANRVKDEFLANLSHELRTPLNSIIGWSQLLLKSGRLDPETTSGLETIERNARTQAQLVDDLLNMSRILSGKLALDLEPLRVTDLLKESIGTVMPAAQARKLKVNTVFEPPDLLVNGDKGRLHQVFWNLLSNAVKFTPPGGSITVSMCRAGEFAEIAVMDTGQGIAPHFLPHVFERFRQQDASAGRAHGGLGLGLSIVKHLIEHHGGRVEAYSPGEGKGARFSVTLPLFTAGTAARAQVPVESKPSRPADISGVKVLVVDDELDAREIARKTLEREKAKVFVAACARDAWSILRDSRPDVILCDIGMKGEDGWEFIRRLRQASGQVPKESADIPAAAVTAFARNEDRERSMSAGYQMHLSKPISPADLIEAVAALRQLR